MPVNTQPPKPVSIIKDVVMLSGGIDSSSLALDLLSKNVRILGVYLNFGQKSATRQQAAAARLAMTKGFPLQVGDLAKMVDMFLHVEDPPHIMMTEAPVRGPGCEDSCMALTTSAIFTANMGAKNLYYAATKEDATAIPKLSEMLQHVQETIRINTGISDFAIHAPFIQKTHPEVLKILNSRDPGVFTWSCHWGGLYHCGACDGCDTRRSRYSAARLEDLTVYSQEHPA